MCVSVGASSDGVPPFEAADFQHGGAALTPVISGIPEFPSQVYCSEDDAAMELSGGVDQMYVHDGVVVVVVVVVRSHGTLSFRALAAAADAGCG